MIWSSFNDWILECLIGLVICWSNSSAISTRVSFNKLAVRRRKNILMHKLATKRHIQSKTSLFTFLTLLMPMKWGFVMVGKGEINSGGGGNFSKKANHALRYKNSTPPKSCALLFHVSFFFLKVLQMINIFLCKEKEILLI